MKSQWSLLTEAKTTTNNYIEALAEVRPDSPWFSGHFPGEPILPGIALIHLVKQAITREEMKKGNKLHLHSLKRIRFTQPVRPGDKLSVMIHAANVGEDVLFSFKVFCKENMVSSGMIAAQKIK